MSVAGRGHSPVAGKVSNNWFTLSSLAGLLPDGRQPFYDWSDDALFNLWFDADSVIHGRANTLFAAEVALGGLDRNVAQ